MHVAQCIHQHLNRTSQLQGYPLGLSWAKGHGEPAMLARRDTGVKETVAWADVAARVPELIEQIQVRPYPCTILAYPVSYVATPCFICCNALCHVLQCPVASVAVPCVMCCNALYHVLHSQARLDGGKHSLDYVALHCTAVCCMIQHCSPIHS